MTVFTGCSDEQENLGYLPEDHTLKIVCTTAMVADLVGQVVGDKAEVTYLVPPGLDPHTFKPSQGDVKTITDADFVVYSGLGLEAKMESVLENFGKRPDKTVHALGSGVPTDQLIYVHGGEEVDPHFWFDLPLWAGTTHALVASLSKADPDNASTYEANAASTRNALEALHVWAQTEINALPAEKRMLVTVHDAFSYFGRSYAIDVQGLMGVSPTGGAGIQDVSALVSFLHEGSIPAVFVESSLPTRNMEAVMEGCAALGHTVKLGGTLYADSTGPVGSDAETFEGTVKHNVNTLVEALK